jgi:hypothetical protein
MACGTSMRVGRPHPRYGVQRELQGGKGKSDAKGGRSGKAASSRHNAWSTVASATRVDSACSAMACSISLTVVQASVSTVTFW